MRPGLTSVVTFPPGGGQGISLSHLGHMSPARYSFTTPGGCDQLSAIYYKPPRSRSEALNPGRVVRGYRGGSAVWAGILDEPAPGAGGWQVTAHGAGTWGADWRAVYSGAWGSGTPDACVNGAIGRGLGWVNPGIGSPAGMWLGQQADSGAQSITDLLTLICTKGGLTWTVTTGAAGNVLSVLPLPTVPNRILTTADPVAQSIASGPDALYIRYQSTADTGKKPAVYATTTAVQQAVIDAQGRREDYVDLSSAGVMTTGAAQAVGNQVLKQFTRAGFAGPFTFRYGQLANMGGTPVDPGVFYADGALAMVCRVLLTDFAFAGEVARGPVQFLVAGYEWDDASMTGTITPFESIRHDFASLMQAALDRKPVRTRPVHRHKKGR